MPIGMEYLRFIREMKDIYNYRLRLLKKYKDPKKVLENEAPMSIVPHN